MGMSMRMQVYDDVEQGTESWHKLRCGVPTASQFSNILTPTGKPTTGQRAINYRNTLLAEWMIGGAVESYQSEWMLRGSAYESEAREAFTFIMDIQVDEVGFCLSDNPYSGCSPDGLIGEDGGLEIKVPAPHTHVQYLIDGKAPNDYIPQLQGSMMVTGRDYWYFMSYHPGMDPLILKVERDDDYITKLAEALGQFNDDLQLHKQKLVNKGYKPIEAAA